MKEILLQSTIDMDKLRELAWKGVETRRDIVWKVLLGILSPNLNNHTSERDELLRKYNHLLSNYDIEGCKRKSLISIDINRTFT
jgi:hypothetical protein